MRRFIVVALMAALLGAIAGADANCFLAGSGTGTVGASGDGGGAVVVY